MPSWNILPIFKCDNCGGDIKGLGVPYCNTCYREFRPTWHQYFMDIAQVVRSRATCPRRMVGAVIVDERKRIVSTGYNGSPHGRLHCLDVGCMIIDNHCRRTIHADCNAIVFAKCDLSGCTMYIYGGSPCWSCAQMIITAGIKEVICSEMYTDYQLVREYLEEAGVSCRILV